MDIFNTTTRTFHFGPQMGLCPKCNAIHFLGSVTVTISHENNLTHYQSTDRIEYNPKGIMLYPEIGEPAAYLKAPTLFEAYCDWCDDVKLIPVDEKLGNLLQYLNAVGMYTRFSCEGHPEQGVLFTIMFFHPIPDDLCDDILYECDGNLKVSDDKKTLTGSKHFTDNMLASVLQSIEDCTERYLEKNPKAFEDVLKKYKSLADIYEKNEGHETID